MKLTFSLLLLLPILTLSFSRGYAELKPWQRSIPDAVTWQKFSSVERDSEFLKFVLDVKTDEMYYLDTHTYKLHLDFWLKVLVHQRRTNDSVKSFNRNYNEVKPNFILGYLTHYPKIALWTFSFWEGDEILAPDVDRAYRALQKSFFVRELAFRPDSLRQEQMSQELRGKNIAVVANDKIYKSLPYQSFQTGVATGVLRIVPPDADFDSLVFKPSEIVLLSKAYPDITPVAGIITTQFSTPLSHVNLRASAWGIPNAAFKEAAATFASLNGETVVYTVTEQNLNVRRATESEKEVFRKGTAPKTIRVPKANLHSQTLTALDGIRASESSVFGSKTANLGAIVGAHLDKVNVPEGFGIPFSFYARHIASQSALQSRIVAILSDPRLKNDLHWRRSTLAELRASIEEAPMLPNDRALIVARWRNMLGGRGVFVRSSTNAEDLKDFNGAGLYDTVPNVTKEAGLEAAIKKVWASVWNERAVAEREFAGIDHQGVYPGVLIQVGVNATAAGVLLTTDIWGHNLNTFTINAKWGLGMRVVNGTNIPEQVLYDSSNQGTRVISHSSEDSMLVFDSSSGLKEVPIPKGDAILTPERTAKLGEAVLQIIPLFSESTALDIEWVLEGEKMWIVQCRPYVRPEELFSF